MKKIILLFSLFFSLYSFGQNSQAVGEVKEIRFYGIDFSNVKVYGASEAPGEFRYAFEGINYLFISEPKKYNVSKFFNKNVLDISVNEVNSLLAKMDTKDMAIMSSDYVIEEEALKKIIKDLPINDNEGTGVVLVAEFLNKTNNRGYYQIVFFDLGTREILDSWRADGKARGFGLRNFWAGSVYDVLKHIKIK